MMEIEIRQASVDDAAEILRLQKLAYQSEARIYNDFSIPPLLQTLEEVKHEFTGRVFLKAVVDGKIIGSVRAYADGETCYIGKLIVDPAFQNRGIGTQLMNAVEGLFPEIKRFELFTGHRSERNLYLYQKKLGYKPFKEKTATKELRIVYLEKVKPGESL